MALTGRGWRSRRVILAWVFSHLASEMPLFLIWVSAETFLSLSLSLPLPLPVSCITLGSTENISLVPIHTEQGLWELPQAHLPTRTSQTFLPLLTFPDMAESDGGKVGMTTVLACPRPRGTILSAAQGFLCLLCFTLLVRKAELRFQQHLSILSLPSNFPLLSPLAHRIFI